MLVVIALGGNALLRRGQPLDIGAQRANVMVAASVLAEVARDHQLVITHGNGPQVGLLALQNAALSEVAPYPLDVIGAETEGMIGYLLEQELGRYLPAGQLATLLTQVVVDPNDPALLHPAKAVGPVYDQAEAAALAHKYGWRVVRDGEYWRRVVPSPEPISLLEIASIRILVKAGITLTCVGGGGIPVVRCTNGAAGVSGIEAVVDKDLAAGLLAAELNADALIMLTDVDAARRDWGTPAATRIGAVSPHELRRLEFAPGSMGPKVKAACRFVESGGSFAAIGALDDAVDLLNRRAGTIVSTDGSDTVSTRPR